MAKKLGNWFEGIEPMIEIVGLQMLDSIITKLASIMSSYKVIRLYAKLLSENDNSKNQVYLGGGFSSLNLLPHSEIKQTPLTWLEASETELKQMFSFSGSTKKACTLPRTLS